MNAVHWQPQLSALALITAHRAGDYTAVLSVVGDTPPLELHVGLVQLCHGLLASFAATSGVTVDEAIDVFRRGMLEASVTE